MGSRYFLQMQEMCSQARAEAAKSAKAAGTTVAKYWENRGVDEDIYEGMLASQSVNQDAGFYAEDGKGGYEVNSISFDDGSLFLETVQEEAGESVSHSNAFDNLAQAKERLDEWYKAKTAKA